MKKILAVLIGVMMSVTMASACFNPVLAGSCAGVETSVIDCDAGNEDGEAVGELLLKAVKIMTGMIAVLAVLGVIIAGYQYMMSSGDAAKTAKAKRRLYEIVIGLVVFALMYVALEFLVPGL